MRILLLSTGFLDYMICLANALSREAAVSLVIPERGLTSSHRSLIESRVRLLPFRYVDYRSVRDNLRMILSLLGTIRREKPDILHIQANGFRLFWLLYPFLKRYVIVNTIHDPSPHSGDEMSPPLPRARQGAINNCAAFFVHGEVLKPELEASYGLPASRIHTIPLGEFSIYQKWRLHTVPVKRHEFLFFGRIWPYKGLDNFIEAANQVGRVLPSARFTIAGAGEDFSRYATMIEQPQLFDVRNYRIPEAELDELFQRCFAVVLPYTDATQSAVIPTAYAYEKPVIATRVGGLPEVVRDGKTGYLIDPGSPAATAAAMLRISGDESTYRELCAGALSFAQNELAWNHVAKKTLKVYRLALALRGPR